MLPPILFPRPEHLPLCLLLQLPWPLHPASEPPTAPPREIPCARHTSGLRSSAITQHQSVTAETGTHHHEPHNQHTAIAAASSSNINRTSTSHTRSTRHTGTSTTPAPPATPAPAQQTQHHQHHPSSAHLGPEQLGWLQTQVVHRDNQMRITQVQLHQASESTKGGGRHTHANRG